MTETEQTIGSNLDPYFKGDALQLGDPYIIVYQDDEQTTVQDLTGVTASDVYFAMVPEMGRTPVLDSTDTGVNVNFGTKSNGEVQIFIDAGVTETLGDGYTWYLEITVSGDTDTVATGDIFIEPK